MIATILFLAAIQIDPAGAAPTESANAGGEVEVEKKIVYQKETVVDLSGSVVEGENQLPPAFFLSKMQTPKPQGALAERLRFSLRNYNDLGF